MIFDEIIKELRGKGQRGLVEEIQREIKQTTADNKTAQAHDETIRKGLFAFSVSRLMAGENLEAVPDGYFSELANRAAAALRAEPDPERQNRIKELEDKLEEMRGELERLKAEEGETASADKK